MPTSFSEEERLRARRDKGEDPRLSVLGEEIRSNGYGRLECTPRGIWRLFLRFR